MSGGGRGGTPLCGLSGREWNSLSNALQKKIEVHLGKLTKDQDDRIGKLEKDFRDTTGRLKTKLNESEAAFKSVDSQLNAANSLVNEVKASSKVLEAECDDLRKQRNSAIEDRHRLQSDLQKRDNQIEILKSDVAELSEHLKRAIESKCEALSKHDEIQNKTSSLEQRERRMEQEKILLNNQIQNLTDDINKYAAELQTVRSEYDLKIHNLQSELTVKNEKLDLTGRRLKSLTEVNNELLAEKNRLSGNAVSRAESENEALDHYKKEIDAKTKLIEMYLNTLEENKNKIGQLDSQLQQLKISESVLRDEKNIFEAENQKLKAEFEMSKNTYEKNIAELKDELTKITVRLEASKEESLSLLLEDMSPAASATCNLIKKMSLTQIYDQVVKLSDALSEVKKENACLDRTVSILSGELKEEKMKLKEKSIDFNKMIQNNSELKNENNVLISKFEKLENEKLEIFNQSEQTNLENIRLKNEIKDLSRQICFLLNEIQDIKKSEGKETNDMNNTNVNIPNSQIAKAFITFKDIEELQSNNLSLIKLVNELKDKLKYPKIISENVETNNIADLLNKRITDLMQAQDHQSKIIDALTAQRDRFEKLYNDSRKSESLNETAVESVKFVVPTITVTDGSEEANLKNLLDKHREDHKKYKEEMQINESILKKQLENTQKKLTDLSTEYAKCNSECKTRIAMYESLKNSVETYKKQISSLEERNKIYDSSILKQDETIRYLRDQAMESLTKLTKNELALENLKHQCKFLQDSENRLKKERDLLRKERFSHSLIINDIELIKVSEQLKEGEERIGMETRLEATNKELLEVQRNLKLQEDKYEEIKTSFEKQLKQTENLLTESNAIIEKKKCEISHLNEQLQGKTKMIDDLNKRVMNLIAMSSQEDTPEVVRKVKDLENQLLICQTEIDSLNHQLSESKEYGKEYYDKFSNIDAEYKKLDSSLTELKQNFENKTQEMQNSEQVLKDKIVQLEMKLSFQSRDLNLLDSNELKIELTKTINMVESLTRDLEEKNNQLQEAKSQVLNLTQIAQKSEDKYAHEMVLHSSDVQTLSNLKKQLTELKAENDNLKYMKNKFENAIAELKNQTHSREKELMDERQKLQSLLNDLRKQNTALHDQLQVYSSSVSTESQAANSLSSDNLFDVIKNLKKENDLAVTKYEMVYAENERLKSEINMLYIKLDDVKVTMESNNKKIESHKQNDNPKTDNVEQVEKLNVLTDSNILLRHERDSLLKRVSQLTETSTSYEEMIKIVQNKNDEFKTKFDLLQTENANLKTEITRWRSRVGSLVEKANKQSPEDWKRLQNERETLAKKLTIEKENAKKLLDEISVLRTAKSDIEEQINTFNLKFTSLTNEYNKQSNELTIVKNDVSRITQELLESKNTLAKESESSKQLAEKLKQNEASLAEITKREGQLRKIANKYKLQYNELLKTSEEQKSASTSESKNVDTSTDEKIIDQLKEQVSNSDEKCTNFEKEIVGLRENLTNFEGIKKELVDSKSNIGQLTELNEKLTKELEELKSSVESSQKSNLEMETRIAEIKLRYDEQILQNERHHTLQERLKNSEIVQLNRKIEYLMNKIKGGLTAQSPKPSTSFVQESATVSEIVKVQSLAAAIAGTSDISSSPSSSQNITENLPSSSSTASHSMIPQFHKSVILPPESTQDVESNIVRDDESPKQSISTASPRIDGSFKTIKETIQSQQAASSSSNNSNSNSTVTTSHGNDGSESSQRIGKRLRQTADQTNEETTGKRLKIQTTESELEYQVPTSSQRDQEDDCVILVDSGDEDNQCGNSYQEISEDMEEDEEEKVVESAQLESQSVDIVEKASSAAVETNEVEVDVQPSLNPILQAQREEEVPNSNEANTDDSPPGVSLSNEQQIETISSVTEGGEGGNGYLSLGVGVGSAGVSGTYDDGSDSIVPSTPVLYLPRRNDDFGEAINSPATESTSTREGCFTFAESRTESNDVAIEDTHADLTPQIAPHLPGTIDESKESSEADAESFQQDEDSALVSSQGSHPLALQQLEEGSEAEASSTNPPSNSRRGQGQRPQSSNNRTSEYHLRQPQRYRNSRPIRRPYRR